MVLPEEQIALMKCQVREGQADLLPAITDSATNRGIYLPPSGSLRDSPAAGPFRPRRGSRSLPMGFRSCRQVMEGWSARVQLRHRCVDARLLVETALAAGFTSIDGGGISHNLSYR